MTKKSDAPAIRFKGFSDAWEQRKFEEIAVRSSVICSDDTLPRVEYEDIVSGTGRLNKDIYAKQSSKSGIVFHQGDVLYGKLRPYLQNWLLPTFDGLAVGDFWVLQPQNADSSFLYRLIQSRQFDEVANQSTGTKMPRADWKLVSKTVFSIPSNISEQAAIGTYFTALDSLITLHQRKFEKLTNVKKSMLEKMFPQNGSSYPEIRFKGFTDPWEQRKAIDIADYSKGNGYSKGDLTDSGTPIILYGRLYTKYQFAISEVDTFAVPRNGAVYSQGNEVIVPASGETAEDIARASAVEKSGVLLGGDLNILRPFDFINPLFLALAISNGEPQKELAKKAQGKSVVHIHNTDIQEVTIAYPSRTEQDRIVSVFRQLDNLITLHQRKFEKLTNVKKSMLEKMFPQNGSSYPEIRFKGFTDPWEQRKLASLCEKFTDGDWIESKDQSDFGVRLVQTGNVGVAEYLDKPNNKKWISEDTFDRLHCEEVLPGDILISRLPEPAGRACIVPLLGTKMITAVDCTIVRTAPDMSNKFLVQYLSSQAYFDDVNTCLAGGTRQRISRGNLANFNVPIPVKKSEQDAIGMFFGYLDNLITLHQRELEKLQNIKKSMLEKMFV